MQFEWDEQKRRENLRKHKIDFVDAVEVFCGPILTRLDTRCEYGEDRWVGIGLAQNRAVVVVYVEDPERETIRVISARKALHHERDRYAHYLQD